MDDVYKTLAEASPEILYKDRKSKFYGYAFPLLTAEAVKPIVENLRKKHHTANHVCFAWQVGVASSKTYRANDDGEPNNSAGMPIYGQIQSYGLTNLLVAVVRIFGGTKLGVGGLIQAYKTTAQLTLDSATVIERIVVSHLRLDFEYPQMDRVMRAIKQKEITLVSQKMELECSLVIAVRKGEAHQVLQFFDKMQHVKVKSLD